MKTKICKNPECENSEFVYKNPKQIFCSSGCKNQFAYQNNKSKNFYEIGLSASRRSNTKIIEQLLYRGINFIKVEVLTTMGFNFHAGNIPKIQSDHLMYRYGNFYLKFLSKTECQILKI